MGAWPLALRSVTRRGIYAENNTYKGTVQHKTIIQDPRGAAGSQLPRGGLCDYPGLLAGLSGPWKTAGQRPVCSVEKAGKGQAGWGIPTYMRYGLGREGGQVPNTPGRYCPACELCGLYCGVLGVWRPKGGDCAQGGPGGPGKADDVGSPETRMCTGVWAAHMAFTWPGEARKGREEWQSGKRPS